MKETIDFDLKLKILKHTDLNKSRSNTAVEKLNGTVCTYVQVPESDPTLELLLMTGVKWGLL